MMTVARPSSIGASAAPIPCHGCGGRQTIAIGEKRGRQVRDVFTYHRCHDCGMISVEPVCGDSIYDDAYYAGRGPDPSVDYENEYRDYRATDRLLEFQDIQRLVEDHLRRAAVTAEPVQWLDFGCGAGGLLKYLRDLGSLRTGASTPRPVALTGHDVSGYARRLRTVDGFNILDLAEVAALPDAQFDVITMIEVLEHIPVPGEAMALVARLLRPGGFLLLTTGNMNSPVARRQGIHYRYCIPEVHISLSTPGSLTALYQRHGLRAQPVRYRGIVAFKVIKSLRTPAFKSLARVAVQLPLVVRLIDALYGVSRMPCAVKPPDAPPPPERSR